MKTIIIAVIVLIILTTIAFLFRRKHIQEIGRLEKEKLQIQHKPILEEMTKVKQLNMTGETEEKFERWRTEWTEVMDVHMPKIDSLLFDVEDMVDRFRFRKATGTEKEIQEKIRFCDNKMNDILKELNELVGSEEKNRIEIEKLKEQHRAARKTVLAHQHSFGMTASPLEKELESFNPKFKEYDELTANGNYLQAREIVISLAAKGERLFMLIHEIPSLLDRIAKQNSRITSGIEEWERKKWKNNPTICSILNCRDRLQDIESEIEEMLAKMAELQIEAVQQQTNEINDRIDSFYDALENEVNAKHYVDENYMYVADMLTDMTELATETSEEAAFVQQSYRLDEKEAQIPQQSLKKMNGIVKRFEVLTARLEEQGSAYSSSTRELQQIYEELEQIAEEQESFTNRMKNLRIDENNVRTKLDELSRKLQNADRMLT